MMALWRNAHGKKLHRHRVVRRWLPRWFFQMNPLWVESTIFQRSPAMACRARMRAGIRRVCKVRKL